MNIRWILSSLLCVGALLHATMQPKKEAPAYDADLFRKDVPVFSFHGSFLYWGVQEGSLDYVLKMQSTPPDGPSYAQGKFHTATFNVDPGFRIAASYFRAPHTWEIWGEYTRLTARGKNGVGAPEQVDRFLTATWPQLIDVPLSKAESHIHMNYNTAELMFDRYFMPNLHLRLRFLGGGLAAFIDQNWMIRYKNLENQNSRINNWWRFIGGGLRFGTMIDWFFGYDVYITAKTTFGTLVGSYHNTTRQVASNEAIPVRNTHFSDVRPTFTIQGMIGPSWQKNFANTRLEIFAGYEINSWFNLQEVYRSTQNTGPGTSNQTWINTSMIALQGLTTRATIDF